MSQITQEHSPVQVGALQVAITVCTLAPALIRIYAVTQPDGDFRFWFLLNGLGYLGLLTAFFLPRFASRHHKISFLLMGYALFTILLWLVLGRPDGLVGYVTNAIELVLAVLAFYEGWRFMRIQVD
jgi:hypothetical protein